MEDGKETLEDYAFPVHRSIMKRQLLFGVPFIPFIVIVIVTAIIVMDLRVWQIIPFSVLAVIIMRMITKKDEYALEIFLSSLFEPDYLY